MTTATMVGQKRAEKKSGATQKINDKLGGKMRRQPNNGQTEMHGIRGKKR